MFLKNKYIGLLVAFFVALTCLSPTTISAASSKQKKNAYKSRYKKSAKHQKKRTKRSHTRTRSKKVINLLTHKEILRLPPRQVYNYMTQLYGVYRTTGTYLLKEKMKKKYSSYINSLLLNEAVAGKTTACSKAGFKGRLVKFAGSIGQYSCDIGSQAEKCLNKSGTSGIRCNKAIYNFGVEGLTPCVQDHSVSTDEFCSKAVLKNLSGSEYKDLIENAPDKFNNMQKTIAQNITAHIKSIKDSGNSSSQRARKTYNQSALHFLSQFNKKIGNVKTKITNDRATAKKIQTQIPKVTKQTNEIAKGLENLNRKIKNLDQASSSRGASSRGSTIIITNSEINTGSVSNVVQNFFSERYATQSHEQETLHPEITDKVENVDILLEALREKLKKRRAGKRSNDPLDNLSQADHSALFDLAKRIVDQNGNLKKTESLQGRINAQAGTITTGTHQEQKSLTDQLKEKNQEIAFLNKRLKALEDKLGIPSSTDTNTSQSNSTAAANSTTKTQAPAVKTAATTTGGSSSTSNKPQLKSAKASASGSSQNASKPGKVTLKPAATTNAAVNTEYEDCLEESDPSYLEHSKCVYCTIKTTPENEGGNSTVSPKWIAMLNVISRGYYDDKEPKKQKDRVAMLVHTLGTCNEYSHNEPNKRQKSALKRWSTTRSKKIIWDDCNFLGFGCNDSRDAANFLDIFGLSDDDIEDIFPSHASFYRMSTEERRDYIMERLFQNDNKHCSENKINEMDVKCEASSTKTSKYKKSNMYQCLNELDKAQRDQPPYNSSQGSRHISNKLGANLEKNCGFYEGFGKALKKSTPRKTQNQSGAK